MKIMNKSIMTPFIQLQEGEEWINFWDLYNFLEGNRHVNYAYNGEVMHGFYFGITVEKYLVACDVIKHVRSGHELSAGDRINEFISELEELYEKSKKETKLLNPSVKINIDGEMRDAEVIVENDDLLAILYIKARNEDENSGIVIAQRFAESNDSVVYKQVNTNHIALTNMELDLEKAKDLFYKID